MSLLSFLVRKLGIPNFRSFLAVLGARGCPALFFRLFLGLPNSQLNSLPAARLLSGSRRGLSTLPYGSSFPPVPSGASEHLSAVDINAASVLLNLEGLCFARRLVLQPFS